MAGSGKRCSINFNTHGIESSHMTDDTSLIVHTDGGSRNNPGQAAIGVVIQWQSGEYLLRFGKPIGIQTNNQAEYQAINHALSYIAEHIMTKNHVIDSIICFADSQLIVNQLLGVYKIKQKELQSAASSIKQIATHLKVPVQYRYIPREKNKEADALVNAALDANKIITI